MRKAVQQSIVRKTLWLFAFLAVVGMSSIATMAQTASPGDIKVSGTVTDETGSGLPGATIVVKGTTTGTTTDIDGNYALQVPEGSTLTVSFIGYQTEELAINGRSIINISLTEDLGDLEEVVVVGYSTQNKASLTSAVSVIGNENIQTTNHTSLAQKLQGKVAGLNIRQASGQPGVFDNDINIRGFGNPIYVIDGIRREGKGEFQQLNANDIESITVLKDASAAIYGLGAANGVILVTTKKGTKGAPKFKFDMNFGALKPTDVPDMANAAQYMEMTNYSAIYERGNDDRTPLISQEELAKWQEGGPGYGSTNWYDEVMKDRADFQQYNLSVTGGGDKVGYYVGFEHLRENGLLKSEDMGYKRYNLRSNITTQLTDNLEAQLLLGVRHSTKTQPGTGFFNIFKGTRVSLPTDEPFANGNPEYPGVIYLDQNPVAFAERDITGYAEEETQSLQSSFSLEYKAPFLEGLSFKGVASYDLNNFEAKNLAKPYFLYTYDSAAGYTKNKYRDGSGNIQHRNRLNQYLTFQGYINFDRKLGAKHHVNAVLVYEQNQHNREEYWIRRYYGDFYTKDVLEFAGLRMESGSNPWNGADVSYIGRVNYSYANKYLLEAAARYMGEFRYAPSSRWGLFPMMSLGWRISEESFIRDNIAMLSNLKLRGSFGRVGGPEGVPFQYVEGYSVNSGGPYEFEDGVQLFGITAPPPANAKLSWQTAETLNAGIDVGLWDNRFTLTADVFQRHLKGIPARKNISLPDTYGGELPQENLNSNLTRGWEMIVGYKSNIGELSYNVSANYTFNRTMAVHREGETFTNSYSKWRNQRADRWQGVVWAYDYAGQFQDEDELRNAAMQNGSDGNITRALPGDFRYTDVNGDGIINGDDLSPILSDGTPRHQYGLNLDLFYKGFDFNMLLQGQAGHTLKFREVYGQIFAFRGNTPAYFYDSWRKEDPYNQDSEWIAGEWPVPRNIDSMPGLTYSEHSMWRRNASYLRLKSVQLGYTFNSDILKKAGIATMRLYTTGFNLITLTDPWVKPHDPEKTNNGPGLSYDAGFGYPLAKTYTVGLNITF